MKRWLALVFWGLLACVAAHAESGPPELQSAARAWMKRTHPEATSIDNVYVFMKPGASLAAVFIDYAGGGTHSVREGMAFKRDASGWAPNGVPLEVYGYIVGGKAVSPDKVVVDTEVLRPGDANCCPTGRKTWTVELTKPTNAASTPSVPASAASFAQDRANQSEWVFHAANGGADVFGVAKDGSSTIHVTCNGGHHSVGFVFYPEYHGHALSKIVERKQAFVVEIRNASGNNRKFSTLAYFVPADGGWVQEDSRDWTGGEARAFLDAFGQDGRLGLQTGKGVEVASWTLKGTSEMRESMRKVCNL